MFEFCDTDISQLKNIINLLIANAFPRDDTFLNKLFDLLSSAVLRGHVHVADLDKSLDLTTVVLKCCQNSSLHPQSYTFFLRLVCFITQSKFSTIEPQPLGLFFNKGLEPSYWGHAAVRSNWVSGVLEIFSVPDGRIWLQTQDVFVKKVESCLVDKVWFVVEAAQKFYTYVAKLQYKEQCDHLSGDAETLSVNLPTVSGTLSSQSHDQQSQNGFTVDGQSAVPLCANIGNNIKSVTIDKTGWFGFVSKLCQEEDGCVVAVKLMQATKHLLQLLRACSDSQHLMCCKILHVLTCLQDVRLLDKGDLQELKRIHQQHLDEENNLITAHIAAWLLQSSLADEDGRHTWYSQVHNPLEKTLRDTSTAEIGFSQHKQSTDIKGLIQRLDVIKSLSAHLTNKEKLDSLALLQKLLSSKIPAIGSVLHAQQTRLLQAFLDALTALFSDILTSKEVTSSFTANITPLLAQQLEICAKLLLTDVAATAMQKALQTALAVLKLLCQVETSQKHCDAELQSLTMGIMKRLCDVRWEVRDSTVEWLAGIFQLAQGSVWLIEYVVKQNFLRQAWLSLGDGEAYVRASALKALTEAAQGNDPKLWQQLISDESMDVEQKLEDIILNDPGSLARSAAVKLAAILHRTGTPTCHQPLVAALTDSDWEVKLSSLQFWQWWIQHSSDASNTNVPEYALCLSNLQTSSAAKEEMVNCDWLQKLCGDGVAAALLLAAQDADKAVQVKALDLLQIIHTMVVERHESRFKKMKMDLSEHPNQVPLESRQNSQPIAMADSTEFLTVETLKKALSGMNFVELLQQANQSTDQHAVNPRTLLEDILTSMAVDSSSQADEDGAMCALAVDCY